jgi:hypothetical protein
MCARTGAVGAQGPLGEHHRIGRLQDFDWRDGRSGNRVVGVAQPIGLRIAAKAAAKEREHHPAATVCPMASDRERIDGAERAGGCPRRVRLGQRAQHSADESEDGFRVACDRPRRGGAEHRGVRYHKSDWPQAARIGRHSGEDVLERHVAGGDGGGPRDVDRPPRRFRRARKVKSHALAVDRQIERDGQELVGDTIVIEIVLEAVTPVRQGADRGAHQCLGAL